MTMAYVPYHGLFTEAVVGVNVSLQYRPPLATMFCISRLSAFVPSHWLGFLYAGEGLAASLLSP